MAESPTQCWATPSSGNLSIESPVPRSWSQRNVFNPFLFERGRQVTLQRRRLHERVCPISTSSGYVSTTKPFHIWDVALHSAQHAM